MLTIATIMRTVVIVTIVQRFVIIVQTWVETITQTVPCKFCTPDDVLIVTIRHIGCSVRIDGVSVMECLSSEMLAASEQNFWL